MRDALDAGGSKTRKQTSRRSRSYWSSVRSAARERRFQERYSTTSGPRGVCRYDLSLMARSISRHSRKVKRGASDKFPVASELVPPLPGPDCFGSAGPFVVLAENLIPVGGKSDLPVETLS